MQVSSRHFTMDLLKSSRSGLIVFLVLAAVVHISSSHSAAIQLKNIQALDASKYIIQPGDIVAITVGGYEDYDQTAVVGQNGKMKNMQLGEVQAAGLTVSQLEENIAGGLGQYISDPHVEVSVKPKEPPPEAPLDEVTKPEATESESEVTPEAEKERVEKPDLEKSEYLKEIQRDDVKASAPPKRFGYDFFTGARNRMLKLEESLAEVTGEMPTSSVVRDAISGFVGPMDMMNANVAATVPSKYVLGPGDRLTLHYWSDVEVMELQTVSLVVDDRGEVIIPRARKIVVRGMTLAQFQEAAREELARVISKNLKLIATLDRLRSIQIFITGETFRPGSYAISAVTTLFNALYMCGGPNDNGSLRNIKLLRNKETKTVDFYRFLMDGDSSQDFSLDAGDTIFISQVGRTATISGEVKRPTEYELKEGENLLELISLAGGIRPSGFLQRVQIDSVDPGKERIVFDIDLSDPDPPDHPVFDGDTVTVFSIPSERMNTVTLEGKVLMPGVYQLKEGMKISDLIKAARWPLGEAYMERADLFRLNPDKKTTKLIPINLSRALADSESASSSDNINLRQWDKLVVYSKWDVKWIADRVVSIRGAVQRPGSYERSDDMTIRDLLIQVGDLLPEAYQERAWVLRLDERGEMTRSIPVDLRDSGTELELKDGDTLLVYTYQEARWEPKREVTVEGAVQDPNTFPRVDGMKVSNLIQRAGGLLPDAYPDRALLLRLDERQRIAEGFFISPELALQDDPRNNLNLRDGDKLTIYTYEQAVWGPKLEVTVAGAVQNPGVFERVDGMRVSDLLRRAGGVLPNAYLARADIKRFRPDHETYVAVPVNLGSALSGDEEADVLLQDEDLLTVYTLREAEYKPKNIAIIYGAVQRPDIYTRIDGMRLSDLLFVAGGILPGAYQDAEIARIGDDGEILILTADVIAITEGDESQDLLLEDEDVVSIRRQSEFPDALTTVTIEGEVKYPGSYVVKRNERLSDLIRRAGGLTDIASPESSVVTRKVDYLILDEQKRDMQLVKKTLDDLNRQEYQREAALARLIEERRRKQGERFGAIPGVSTPSETPVPTAGADVPIVSTMEEVMEVSAIAGIPGQAQAAVSSIEEMAGSQYTLVTPARKIDWSLPSTKRLVLDLREAIDQPGTANDIIVKDGDKIMIPPMPDSISIFGAVTKPTSYVYIKGKKIKDYVEMAGGYSTDANRDAVYVIKSKGIIIKGEKTRLSPGDVIVVPAKVMVQKVTDRWGQVIGAIKFAVTTVATVYTVKLILERI